MEVLYYRDPSGNFGDDLNALVWKELLPASVFEAKDVLLMGIGSIFNEQRAPLSKTKGKRVFVLGSGAGYGPLPQGWEEWNILAVRGPLTAELLGKPEAAVTDSAVLLAVLPQIVTLAEKRESTLLIPHHYSSSRGEWQRVAQEMGMTYVDPRWSVPVVMDHFSRAKLVVTEAMHGAICADTMRIPWIPISIAPDALPFKWTDWAHSLNMKYDPTRIAPSSAWEKMNHRDFVKRANQSGVIASAFVEDTTSTDALISDFRIRYKTLAIEKAPIPRKGLSKHIRTVVKTTSKTLDRFYVDKVVTQLRKVVQLDQRLSDDHVFTQRLMQMQDAVQKFVTMTG